MINVQKIYMQVDLSAFLLGDVYAGGDGRVLMDNIGMIKDLKLIIALIHVTTHTTLVLATAFQWCNWHELIDEKRTY